MTSNRVLIYSFLALLIYFPLFGHLSTLPIRIWDEARLAINAYEMSLNGNFLVTYYDNLPDMWNTKPPLMIWLQVLFINLLGFNELSIRLPSAIAGFLTCCIIFAFVLNITKSEFASIFSVLALITNAGYVNMHSTRSGDYDALLTLFTTLYVVCFFIYIERQKNSYLYLFFLFVMLSVLTKSISGLFFIPALFIYIIYSKNLVNCLKNKHLYIGLILSITFVLTYYLGREFANNGYINVVFENELGGRFMQTLENHNHSAFFYAKNILFKSMSHWIVFIPLFVIVGLTFNNSQINRLFKFLLINILTLLTVITIAKTKLEWYDVPIFPLVSIIIGISLYIIYDKIIKIDWGFLNFKNNIIVYYFPIIFFFTPYKTIFEKTFLPKEEAFNNSFYDLSYYLKDVIKGKKEIGSKYLVYEGYKAHILFYYHIINKHSENLKFKGVDDIIENDTIIVSQTETLYKIKKKFLLKKIENYKSVSIYKVSNYAK
jgi:4-amino-4-deoxy-L-arabinose transferase-like glycosyltransferase